VPFTAQTRMSGVDIGATAGGAPREVRKGAAGAVIANTLIDIDPRYPTIDEEARANLKEIKKTLEAQAPPGAAADPFADTDSESEKS